MASNLSKLFDSVSVKAVVDGVVVKVSTPSGTVPKDFSWDATRKTVIGCKELKTAATIAKDTVEERSFRGKDKNGEDFAEHIAPNTTAAPSAKGSKRGAITEALETVGSNGSAK